MKFSTALAPRGFRPGGSGGPATRPGTIDFPARGEAVRGRSRQGATARSAAAARSRARHRGGGRGPASASTAYALQLGWKRQLGGRAGEIQRWYPRSIATSGRTDCRVGAVMRADRRIGRRSAPRPCGARRRGRRPAPTTGRPRRVAVPGRRAGRRAAGPRGGRGRGGAAGGRRGAARPTRRRRGSPRNRRADTSSAGSGAEGGTDAPRVEGGHPGDPGGWSRRTRPAG